MSDAYPISESEILNLAKVYDDIGAENIRKNISTNVDANMAKAAANMDVMLLDQSESILEYARSISEESDKTRKLKVICYDVHRIFRDIAHTTYRVYLKTNKDMDNERFIRLASYNESAPLGD